jgi:AraC-like DNA-binding protein
MAIGSIYRPLLEVARESGVDVDAVLADTGLSFSQVVEGHVRLAPDRGRALARKLARLTRNSEIGLQAAERLALADLDIVGYLVRYSANAMQALEALTRFARLLGDTADFRLLRAEQHVRVSLALTGGQMFVPEGADFAAAALSRLLRELSHGKVAPREVHLPRPTPRRPALYRRFFGAPIVFAAECAALVYDETVLSVPFAESDGKLLRILEQRASDAASQLPAQDSWLSRVRAETGRSLAQGSCDAADIAWRCGVSERTLRRRLEEARTSFRELLDDVRRERALRLIEAGEQRVGALAHAAGYTDLTAFGRAFKRWLGVPPQTYLASLRAVQEQ